MIELLAIALVAAAGQAATIFIAFRAMKAQREANDAALSLARETLIAAKAVVPVEEIGKDAERAEEFRAEVARRRWRAEQAHREELTRRNDLYFGTDEIPAGPEQRVEE